MRVLSVKLAIIIFSISSAVVLIFGIFLGIQINKSRYAKHILMPKNSTSSQISPTELLILSAQPDVFSGEFNLSTHVCPVLGRNLGFLDLIYRDRNMNAIAETFAKGSVSTVAYKDMDVIIEKKPVLYFYPVKEQRISVKLQYQGEVIADYPKYDYSILGWEITAYPDGRILNLADGKEYSYIFWEGKPFQKIEYDLTKGFIVKGEDTAVFLQETLEKFGLIPKEYNEFIVYWLPRMKNNKYNLIHFSEQEYEKTAPLDITPKPDSILRVFMIFKPLSESINIEPQKIKPFLRRGFTVIEWGGEETR